MLKLNTDIQPAYGGIRSEFRDEAIATIGILNKVDPLDDFVLPRYAGVSSIQVLYWLDGRDIYITESTQYREIVGLLKIRSQQPNFGKYFGKGAFKIKELLFDTMKVLYPTKMSNWCKTVDIYKNDDEYSEYVQRMLQRHYQLIIYKNENGTYTKIMIPLYRLTNEVKGYKHLAGDERIEFSGGILHFLQHFDIDGKPLSAVKKEQDGITEFNENNLIEDIIDGVEKWKENGTKPKDLNFKTKLGENKTIGIYLNEDADVISINTIAGLRKK
jgi:hypothetical protein